MDIALISDCVSSTLDYNHIFKKTLNKFKKTLEQMVKTVVNIYEKSYPPRLVLGAPEVQTSGFFINGGFN